MSFTRQRQRLLTKEQLDESRLAWDSGHFSPEWKPWRHMAAMEAGIVVPPKGGRFDSWDDNHPSERAQIIRAIRETPAALEAAIRSSNVHSWAAVIAQLVRRREGIGATLDLEETWQRRDASEARQATYRLKEILQVIGDS